MGLIQCKVCDKEVSETAKACPHCGEPNRIRTTFRTLLVYALYLIILALGCLLVIMIGNGAKTAIENTPTKITDAPYCTSEDGMEKAKQAFNENPWAKALSLQIIAFEKPDQVFYDFNKDIRHCKAVAIFNTSVRGNVEYFFQLNPNSTLLVTTRLEAPKCTDADAKQDLISEIERKVGYQAEVLAISDMDIRYIDREKDGNSCQAKLSILSIQDNLIINGNLDYSYTYENGKLKTKISFSPVEMYPRGR